MLAHQLSLSGDTVDDAFISFRYASNLINGNGLVFNSGVRVEGYTNFLWVMISAAWMKAGVPPELGAKITGALCSLGILLLLFRSVGKHCLWAAIAPVLLAFDPNLNYWSTAGLETPLFVFLIFAGFLKAKRDAEKNTDTLFSGLILGGAYLTRPEGAAVFVFLGFFLIVTRRNESNRLKFHFPLKYILGFMIPFAPHLIWRYFYYGSFVPNTFYAKTGGGFLQMVRGFFYFVEWLQPEFIFLISAAALGFFVVKDKAGKAAGALIIFFIFYTIKIGGDFFGHHRFMVPLMPFVYFLIGQALLSARSFIHGLAAVCCGAVLIINGWNTFRTVSDPSIYSRELELNHPKTLLAKCLKKHARKNDSVATNVIGRLSFYSGLTTYDVFGLTEPYIARRKFRFQGLRTPGHEKSDHDYIMSKMPTYSTATEGKLLVYNRFVNRVNRFARKYMKVEDDGFRVFKPPQDLYSLKTLECGGRKYKIYKLKTADQSCP